MSHNHKPKQPNRPRSAMEEGSAKESGDSLAAGLVVFEELLIGDEDPELAPELAAKPDFVRVHGYLRMVKEVLRRLSTGSLDFDMPLKGATAGYLKSLQANLHHLARQFHSVASGDLTRRADGLNEFSLAFNRMTDSLKKQRQELEDKQKQLTRLTRRLQQQIRQQDTIEAALRASENTYRQLALRDPLTGIYNRGYFFEIATREIENVKRNGGDLCLVMIDVDHFKKYNDAYGHLSGDAALRMITGTVAGLLRKADLLARYGGEEFVLLLAGTALEAGLIIAERIREAVAAQPAPAPQCPGPITISLGLACLSGVTANLSGPADNILNNTLMEADAALYTAKERGRNMVWWRGRQEGSHGASLLGVVKVAGAVM